MSCQQELKILCDTLKKCRVRTAVLSPIEPVSRAIDFTVRDIISGAIDDEPTVHGFVGNLASETMYKYTDEFNLCYIYFKLTEDADSSVLFVGPYLSSAMSSKQLLELGEQKNIPPKALRAFESYYGSIPVLPEGSALFIMLDTFCEHIWGSSSFVISDVNARESISPSLLSSAVANDNFDDTLLNIKTMEMRYNFENELIRAVSLGQLHKEKLLSNSFSDKMFEKRVADPLRNAKNYAIIMNTLLRKAVEQGGVHPIHIDKISSGFAIKIEQMSALDNLTALMKEMYRSYCRLVRKHSLKSYSPIVQKTILLIDGDLSADLSLSSLATQQSISAAYLSSLFKKETDKTISEYVREKRIKHAAQLLATTHLQIQTIALHCGIMDVQYFSKMFKKHMGKTPKEYRAEAQQ